MWLPTALTEKSMGRISFVGVQPVLLHRTPSLVGSTVAILKFIIFEQGTSCFHFAPGPTKYVASPAHRDPLVWPLFPFPFSFEPYSSLTFQPRVSLVLHQFLKVVPASGHLYNLFPCREHHSSFQDQLSSLFSKFLLILQI